MLLMFNILRQILPFGVATGRIVAARLMACVLVCMACAGTMPGCAPQTPASPLLASHNIPNDALIIPANLEWTDTGVDLAAGEPVSIAAQGRIRINQARRPQPGAETEVGPQGTFLYSDDLASHDFPLPAAGMGPAPCYCLIGRIGHGATFFVGEARSWVAEQSGRLYLGINDFKPSQNTGEFYVQVTKPAEVQPVSFRENVPLDVPPHRPDVTAAVVVVYIDGLRPDVVEEMAAMGHIPNLRKHFVEGGTHLCNAFTAFPSDTITSNGTMWTGCFSDRHGLKGQVRFSRYWQSSDSFLEPMGPNRSSRTLGPHGLDKVVHDAQAAGVELVQGDAEGRVWRASKTSHTPAIYDYLRKQGENWATGVLPLMTDVPPVLWTRSMARFLPYFQAHEAWKYIDDANSHYAVRHLLHQQQPVTIIWMPETDSVSHKQCRGQFGSTRKTIAKADKLVGEIVAELTAQDRLQETYLVLVSDHGHLGGRNTFLSRFDLANEFFFNSREMSKDGRWLGGGMGMSVRQHRYSNQHTSDGGKQFVFVDGDSDGTARIFLPRGHYRSGDWSAPNSAASLLAYPVEQHLHPINLPATLAGVRAVSDAGVEQSPIDLVLLKLTDASILITTGDRGQAVIERRRAEDGKWVYRYMPVENVNPTTSGAVEYQVVADPQTDPLGLVPRANAGFLQSYHDEQTWLWVTATTDYPDSVVSLTRHMLWQDSLKVQEHEYAPDLVVTARHGWLFGVQNTPGTTHGYPLAESMRATWYISGPNIRRGARIEAPCRLVDLTPTLLELTGTPYDPRQMDGRALTNIFRSKDDLKVVASPRSMYWRDFDLQAWQPLKYSPAAAYAHMPLSINRPASGWDLNNVVYNVLAIGDWSVLRLVDDIATPVTPQPTHITRSIEKVDQRAGNAHHPWVAEGVQALNVPEVTLSDYSLTSTGNLKRADGALDWLQERGNRLDRKLARPVGHRSVIGTPATNIVIDTVQGSFWEIYRFAQRVLVEILDETVLNGVENGVDSTINIMRSTPAEIVVDDPDSGNRPEPATRQPRASSRKAPIPDEAERGGEDRNSDRSESRSSGSR